MRRLLWTGLLSLGALMLTGLRAPVAAQSAAATRVGAAVTLLPPPLRTDAGMLDASALRASTRAGFRWLGKGQGAVPVVVQVREAPSDRPRARQRTVQVTPIA